jgi:hypothetical protein
MAGGATTDGGEGDSRRLWRHASILDRGVSRRPSMRTLARVVDAGRCRWSADEARRPWAVTGVLAAAWVAARNPPYQASAAGLG